VLLAALAQAAAGDDLIHALRRSADTLPAADADLAARRREQRHPGSFAGQDASGASRPCQVVMHASFPSGSANTQNAGASAS
jgi:hypothetical protein